MRPKVRGLVSNIYGGVGVGDDETIRTCKYTQGERISTTYSDTGRREKRREKQIRSPQSEQNGVDNRSGVMGGNQLAEVQPMSLACNVQLQNTAGRTNGVPSTDARCKQNTADRVEDDDEDSRSDVSGGEEKGGGNGGQCIRRRGVVLVVSGREDSSKITPPQVGGGVQPGQHRVSLGAL